MTGYPYYLPTNGNPYMGNFQSPMQRLQNYEQQQQQQYSQVQQQNQGNGIIWVQGAEGAKSFMLAPNSTVLLMDSEGTRFYIKSTDLAGMPSMRTFEFREITNIPQGQVSVASESSVSREEFNSLKNRVDQYENLLSALTAPPVNNNPQPNVSEQKGGNLNGKSTS